MSSFSDDLAKPAISLQCPMCHQRTLEFEFASEGETNWGCSVCGYRETRDLHEHLSDLVPFDGTEAIDTSIQHQAKEVIRTLSVSMIEALATVNNYFGAFETVTGGSPRPYAKRASTLDALCRRGLFETRSIRHRSVIGAYSAVDEYAFFTSLGYEVFHQLGLLYQWIEMQGLTSNVPELDAMYMMPALPGAAEIQLGVYPEFQPVLTQGQIVYLQVDNNGRKRGQPLEVLGDVLKNGEFELVSPNPTHLYVRDPEEFPFYHIVEVRHVTTEPIEVDLPGVIEAVESNERNIIVTERVDVQGGALTYATYGDVEALDSIPDDTEPIQFTPWNQDLRPVDRQRQALLEIKQLAADALEMIMAFGHGGTTQLEQIIVQVDTLMEEQSHDVEPTF